MMKYLIVLISLSLADVVSSDSLDYAPADGFRNNLGQPAWGIAGSNFLRGSPAAYSDGTYRMAGINRPSPMDISLTVHSGPSGQPSLYGRNALQAFYAQLILDELASVSTPGCPPEYENLEIPSQHPLFNVTQRAQVYLRSGYDQSTGYSPGAPRQQTNTVTSFLDGGVIYGTSRVWTSMLRTFKDGKLLADNDFIQSSFPVHNDVKLPLFNAPIPHDHELKSVDRLFRVGNAKGHENPFLLALQIVWFRWHNKVAEDIKSASQEELSDEELFQMTKRKVVAHFQKIALIDWLPSFIYGNQANGTGVLQQYQQYDSRKQPGITHEFLAAMNFRHSFSPGSVWTLG